MNVVDVMRDVVDGVELFPQHLCETSCDSCRRLIASKSADGGEGGTPVDCRRSPVGQWARRGEVRATVRIRDLAFEVSGGSRWPPENGLSGEK